MNIYIYKWDCLVRDDVFKQIVKVAIKENVIDVNDGNKLFDSLIAREKLSTTGFEDGFAIPHARITAIKKPAIILIQSSKPAKWESLDGKGISVAIGLLIPEKDGGNLHLDALSSIARLLLIPEFRNNLKQLKNEKSLLNYLKTKLEDQKTKDQINQNLTINKSKKLIVGVSACATGVAHTYMAKDALEIKGKELGYNIKIETQGQKGQEYILTDQEINDADAVIVAADIYVELDRFSNKKLLKIKTNDAISNPGLSITESLKAPKFQLNGTNIKATNSSQFKSSKVKDFMGHLLSGVSRMIPFIVFSGIMWAIINSLGSIEGLKENNIYIAFKAVSEIGFTVFIAIMGGFIAESIAGRAGLAPGFIATFAAANSAFYFWWDIPGLKGIPQIDNFFSQDTGVSNVGLSLFAAIMMGFAAGYLVKWINSWKTHKLVTPLMPIIFIPVVATSILVFPFVLLLSGPLGYLMNGLVFGLSEAGRIQGVDFLIGFLLGCMIGVDMGGPINKIAGTTATALIIIDPRLMGAVSAAIPIAPLGCGLATLWFGKMFSEKEKAEGVTALGLGFFGISEGAIPFAVNRPKQVLIANIIASGIAGGLAFLFYVGGYVGMWGGPIVAIVVGIQAPITELGVLGTTIPDAFGGAGNGMQYLAILWFFLAIIGGTILHALILVFGIKMTTKSGKREIKQKLTNFKNFFKKPIPAINHVKTNITNFLITI